MGRLLAAGLVALCLVGGIFALRPGCYPTKTATTLAMRPEWKDKIMQMHHEERRKVGLPPNVPVQNQAVLKWSPVLAQKAAAAGGHCKFEHSAWDCRTEGTDLQGNAWKNNGYMGESIAGLSNQGRPGWTTLQFVEALVKTWTDEKQWWTHARYPGTKGSCPSNKCGHYIQVIQHDTREIGCTINTCTSGYLSFAPSLSTVNIRCFYGEASNWPNDNPTQPGTGDCATNVCGDHGRCFKTGASGHTCKCEPGYQNNGGASAACVQAGGGGPPPTNPTANPTPNPTAPPPVNKCATTTEPCSRHGSCTNDASKSLGYFCTCSYGWAGDRCERLASSCNPSTTCSGRGTCKTDGTCNCNSGWDGASCSNAICPTPNPCQNGGTCVPSGASYTCNCQSGYTGGTCTIPPSGAGANSPNTPTHAIFINFRKKIDDTRKLYQMPALQWTNQNVNDAKTESNKCRLHGTTGKAAHGQGVSEFPMCGAKDQFPSWGTYMGEQFWRKALGNKNVNTAGCWISDSMCPTVCGSSPNFRVFSCTYTTFDGSNVVPNAELTEEDLKGSSEWSEKNSSARHNGSFMVVGAACVVVAAAVVAVLVVRRRNAAEEIEADYAEMT